MGIFHINTEVFIFKKDKCSLKMVMTILPFKYLENVQNANVSFRVFIIQKTYVSHYIWQCVNKYYINEVKKITDLSLCNNANVARDSFG